MNIIPFKLEHLDGLPNAGRVSPWYFDTMTEGPAVTFVTHRVIGCGGVIPTTMGTGILWSWLTKDTGPHMLGITRAAHRLMGVVNHRRLEATVEDGFPAGCRWLEMLGFELETPNGMKAFGLDGKKHYLYGWAR